MQLNMNKKEAIDKINKDNGWNINYMTFMYWENKGYVQNDNFCTYVGRKVRCYTEEDCVLIAEKLKELHRQKKIRLQAKL